ncbi:hypothetical protein M5689_023628 [Euphorbia peplus]|nr:hypothetical protein M5689_023628 [Euphorbia peplus]
MSAFMNSPIEALLFDHLTVVNNLWTWVALATAAVSFWWIRTASSAVISISLQSREVSSNPTSSDHSCEVSSNPISSDVSSAEPAAREQPPLVASNFQDDVTRGKFVVYFDRENDDVGESEVTVAGDWGCGGGCGGLTESFEREVRMRMGDLGWYRCQDLTAINGNVVRLWDGIRV